MSRLVQYRVVSSPIGDLVISGHDSRVLTRLDFADSPEALHRAADWERHDAAFDDAARQLQAYFAGDLTEFRLELAPAGTAFQQRVWNALRNIPYGTTMSYGRLATALGNPKAMRAVGLANGRNPIAIVIPCHRLVGADGSPTGYGGGIQRKQWLLAHERR